MISTYMLMSFIMILLLYLVIYFMRINAHRHLFIPALTSAIVLLFTKLFPVIIVIAIILYIDAMTYKEKESKK